MIHLIKRQHSTSAQSYDPIDDTFFIPAAKLTNVTPNVRLSQPEYKKLIGGMPQECSTVGVVLGMKGGKNGEPLIYQTPYPTVYSLVVVGLKIKFITPNPETAVQQLVGCQALVLPDENFELPGEYYLPAKKAKKLSPLCQTYQKLIECVEKLGLPILAIGNGAQMVGGCNGMRIKNRVNTKLHNVPFIHAHHVNVGLNPAFKKIICNCDRDFIQIPSHHSTQMIIPDGATMKKLAVSTADDLLEAWGDLERKIICIQWDGAFETAYLFPRSYIIPNSWSIHLFLWIENVAKEIKPIEKKDLM